MAVKTWFGGSGSFDNASDWSPSGAPQAGDTAVIDAGTCEVVHQDVSNIDLVLGGYLAQQTVLDLKNAVIGNLLCTHGSVPSATASGYQTIDIAGRVVFGGSIALGGGLSSELTINLAHGGVLVNKGTIAGDSLGLILDITGSTGAALVNDGLIREHAGGASMVIEPVVVGTGTIELGGDYGGTMEFSGLVGCRQTLAFDNSSQYAGLTNVLEIDIAREFHGMIAGFGARDTIELAKTTVTSDEFKYGALTLLDGHRQVAHLWFAGSYTANEFVLHQSGDNAMITFHAA